MMTALEGRAPRHHAPGRTDEHLPIEEVWRRFQERRSPAMRERLVEHYMRTHVRPIAERLRAHLPRQVDVDDLVQQGYLGLSDAISRFDAEREVRFETFSSQRIYGAMRDYLREIDPVPRLMRSRAKRYEAEIDRFRVQHGRSPTDEEIKRGLSVGDKQFRKYQRAAGPATMVSFSSARPEPGDDEDADAMDAFEDDARPSPFSEVERDDLKQWVTKGFTRRDRLIVILYYFERMTMKEIGRTIGCSESRVSQRLDSIIECLRSRLVYTGAEQEFYSK